MNKPQRICIIGNSGSGKSTLADELGRQLSIPVYHLDHELLHGQFEPYPLEEQRVRHLSLLRGENWIIDGNYRKLLPERLNRATMVIFLDVSRTKTIPRVLRRYFQDDQIKASVPEQAKNDMSWKFMKWVVSYSRRKRLSELKDMNPPQLVVLRKGTVEDWVNRIITS